MERLRFVRVDREGAGVAEYLDGFRACGSFSLYPGHHAELADGWAGARFDDDAVCRCIEAEFGLSGVLLDPHSAVGVLAARACRRDPSVPMVALATAHPAKFPDPRPFYTSAGAEGPPR